LTDRDTLPNQSYRGRIEIQVDFEAPFSDPSTELVRLAACAIEAIATQPDVGDVRGLEHWIERSDG
jgi:hypothetical protein